MIKLAVLERCHSCQEFEAETTMEILYGDNARATVNTVIGCKHRTLCNRIYEHLKEEMDNVSCTTSH